MPQRNRAKATNMPQVGQFLEYRLAGVQLLLLSAPIQQGGGAAWADSGQAHQRCKIRSVRVQRPLHGRGRGNLRRGGHLHAVVPVNRTAGDLDDQKKQADSRHDANTQLVSPCPTPFRFPVGCVTIGDGIFRWAGWIRGRTDASRCGRKWISHNVHRAWAGIPWSEHWSVFRRLGRVNRGSGRPGWRRRGRTGDFGGISGCFNRTLPHRHDRFAHGSPGLIRRLGG